MGPYFHHPALQRRGNLRISILSVGHLPCRAEVLLRAAVIDHPRLNPRSRFMRSCTVSAVRRRGGIRIGRLISLPAGSGREEEYHNAGMQHMLHHEAISWPTA